MLEDMKKQLKSIEDVQNVSIKPAKVDSSNLKDLTALKRGSILGTRITE